MEATTDPRVVLVHDWLTGMRGGEKCLEPLCQRWPGAPLYTLLHKPGSVSPAISNRPIRTSFLQRLPRVHDYYRYLLPAMPAAAASWRVPPCDLLVSLSHCVAKAVVPPGDVPHVCYCFTPMRYAWHMKESYFAGRTQGLRAVVVDRLLHHLREWDRRTADRVTHFVAISRTVQERIAECYGRRSTVIYPPVDTDFYSPSDEPRTDEYLVVSALAPYKRIDLAVAACQRLGRSLTIIGTGQDDKRLRARGGPGVRFLGWQPDEVIRAHLRRCRALLFPGEEDFGIVPLEAQACGMPVIAYGRGGALETVVAPNTRQEGTGLFFEEQTVEALIEAIERFEAVGDSLSPLAARRQALRFSRQRFADELFGFLDDVMRPAAHQPRKAA